MRDYKIETEQRIGFIREQLKNANAEGIIFGNSGGKDSALVGILCKKACENTVGVIMPCVSASNYGDDKSDALALAEQFNIETRIVDLTDTAKAIKNALGGAEELTVGRAGEIGRAGGLTVSGAGALGRAWELDGVGELTIVVTLDSLSENVFSERGSGIKTVITPKVRGVAIICEGGDDVIVKQKIVELVSRVLGINTTKISVTN